MSKGIPFLSLDYQIADIRKELTLATRKVFDSGHFLLGKQTVRFEEAYAKFSGTAYCAAVGNGHDALYLALRALNIGAGDEVIVPSNTCSPTWLAVTATGARVVPVEPSIETYNIRARDIALAITSRTKAIVPVHLYGQACRMDDIMTLASQHKIHIVEDNAQGHGASFAGQPTGSFGVVNATSFYPTKNLGALGDGGAVTTSNAEYYQRICALRNYGTASKGIAAERGINSRLDELQAAILQVKLKRLKSWNKLRKKIATQYLKELKGVSDLILPRTEAGSHHVYHMFVVRTSQRDELRAWLKSKRIDTMIHYPVPPHLQPAFADHAFFRGQFPVAEEIAATCLSLPCWPGMKVRDCKKVAEAILKFFSRKSG